MGEAGSSSSLTQDGGDYLVTVFSFWVLDLNIDALLQWGRAREHSDEGLWSSVADVGQLFSRDVDNTGLYVHTATLTMIRKVLLSHWEVPLGIKVVQYVQTSYEPFTNTNMFCFSYYCFTTLYHVASCDTGRLFKSHRPFSHMQGNCDFIRILSRRAACVNTNVSIFCFTHDPTSQSSGVLCPNLTPGCHV